MLIRRLIPLYGVAVAASYVVVPFLPLLCDVRRPRAGCSRPGVTLCNVRRPRAGCSRPGVTVSGAPAKVSS
ncbi:hypothetical protein L249_6043 [Ophiocordyceps polyrhachis-furcata BCC 54312]|uniref:Uncharacterized protein n=1 Tax=Ophiocordyceps polyrhachis-furcata BCC 54312 TaxID=1330021 RepID=A0A367LIQ3_9HYPO|nr:hypothetical protein L249_6043 [Ophiocordyceps polyrhachis-furcata BCC 54312]